MAMDERSNAAAQEHVRRFHRYEEELQQWLPTWSELLKYITPRKANIEGYKTPGSLQTEEIMDSTAIHANELLAASMQGSLTSGSIKFFYYRIRGLGSGIDQPTDVWLEQNGELSYDELKQSNFSAEAHEFYSDLGCVGTAVMFVEQKEPKPGQPWTGFRFKTLAPGTYVIDENEEGLVDTLYYKFKLSVRAAANKFGAENLPESMRAKLDNPKEIDQQYDFIHCIYPRKDNVLGKLGYDIITPANRDWASVYVSLDEPKILEVGGYHEFPAAVARWTKFSGEKYGRSPGYTALPDIKTLNKLVELKLRALALQVFPPLKVRDAGVLGKVRLSTGGLTHLRDMDSVAPLLLHSNFDTAVLEVDKLQSAIRRMFFSDQLQLQEGPQMTAYEVQVRYELMQRILGPTLGRLETEFLEPVISRIYYMLERAKRLPEMPDTTKQLIAASGGKFDIEYEGPLQRAQRLGDVVTIQRFFQLGLPLIEADPDTIDNLDMDVTMRIIAKDTGAPPQILRSEADRDARRAERKQQQQEAAQQQQTQETMKAAGSAAPAMKALVEAQQAGILPQGGLSGQGAVTGGVGR